MITVSHAQRSDVVAVAAMEELIFSDAMHVHVLEDAVESNLFLVARKNDEIVGYFIGQCVLDEMEILRIAISPNYRRLGYGRFLLNAAKQVAIKRGITYCYLEVRESNSNAIALYKSFDFLQYGRRSRFYRQPDEDAILMKAQWSVEKL